MCSKTPAAPLCKPIMDASPSPTAIASIPVRLHVLIGVLVVWCASGLVAFDMSRLFPSAMTPVLAKLTVPIMLSGGLLMIAPFAAHATGLISYKNFRVRRSPSCKPATAL